ncbi:MAG: xanthine dehydrogenase family protein molybdopterin-binding subunit, partial [Pseudomonadota bacterium]
MGASVLRKEDDRFLRGRGQYVGDFRLAGTREVAFVRSPVAHARLRRINIPAKFRTVVFTADDLKDVKPIISAPPLRGFKYSVEPILATGKLRYVGEMAALCVADSRAEAEDIAAAVTLEFDELSAVTDMRSACAPGSALVHEEWGDNIFVSFEEGKPINKATREDAAIKVARTIRTSRHCMFPMEGRGVLAYRDARLRNLTLITSTQFPNSVQTGLAQCLGLEHGNIRVISPDVGGGFGYKGLLCREEVALGWLALQLDHPVRWLEDCREHLAANANCREHYYEITGYATADGILQAIECNALVDAGAYSSYPISSSVEAAQIANLLPGPYVFSGYHCRAAAVATNKCPIIPYRGVARTGVCLAIEVAMDAIAREAGIEPYEVRLHNMVRPEQMPFDNLVGKHFDSGDHPECLRRAVAAIGLKAVRERQKRAEPDGRLIGVGLSFFVEQGAHGTSVLASWGRPIVPGYEQANVKLTADGELEIHVGTHSH